MPVLTLLLEDGPRTISVEEGALAADVLGRAGLDVDMPCGGQGRCGKCRVWASGRLSPPDSSERGALREEELREGFRLACRCRILGDAQLRPAYRAAVSQICASGAGETSGPVEDPLFHALGAAVDIGTTTLAAQLYGRSGLLGSAAAPNPQRTYGADVISRIGRAMAGDGPALAGCIRRAVSALLEQMCRAAGRDIRELDGLAITGNTAMLHLLTGTDPAPLAAAPFQARELFGKTVPAGALELPCPPDTPVYLPRCVSAFVGGDITTALLASGICGQRASALLMDIGTNGEIALWHKGELLCCSTAAGPAFEGAGLSQGMQGAPGAIDHVCAADGALLVHTIGDRPAVGICGSGAIDAVAALLAMGALDETGCFTGEEDEYPLTEQVRFTQQDIRQIQLAKSAIRAGTEALLHRAGVSPEELSQAAVAGGFGSYVDLGSAAAIGLVHRELVERCRVLGNAALAGAAMLLRRGALAEESEALARRAKTLDLAADPYFMEQYVEQMLF